MLNQPAFENLRTNQRQLDQDGVEVGVSRQALDEVLNAYAAMSSPHGEILLILHDALGCFWNAAIGAAHDRQESAAMSVADIMAQGISAVAERLKEHADDQKPARIERRVYRDGPEYGAYHRARFLPGLGAQPSFVLNDGHRWGYSHTAFDDQGDYDLIWRPADAAS